MEKVAFKEALQHGTTSFPIAVYPMHFAKNQQVLAHLHYHNEFELIIATKGQLAIQTEETTFFLSEGEGLFINSGVLHTIINAGFPYADSGFTAVVFDYSLLCREQDVIYENYIQPLLQGSLEPNPRLCPDACACIADLCCMYEAGAPGYEIYIKHCLLQILYLLLQESKVNKLSSRNSKSVIVKAVLGYIKQNYSEQISLQQLADHAHVSKEYLCRLFHRISGSSPMEYLNRYRIRQSTFLLLQTDDRISDIALSCGFSHSSYFGKLFINYMGCTPTEYRNQHNK